MCRHGQATNTERCVSLLPPPPQVPSPGTLSPGSTAAAAGEGSTSPPFFGAVFHIPGVPPIISTHPFAWKPNFHKTTRRDVFSTLGQIKETRGFCSAIAGQMLQSHLKHGDTCQKTQQREGTQVETPGVSAPGTGCSTEDELIKSQPCTQISSNIPGVDPFGKPRQNTSLLGVKRDLTPVSHFHLKYIFIELFQAGQKLLVLHPPPRAKAGADRTAAVPESSASLCGHFTAS